MRKDYPALRQQRDFAVVEMNRMRDQQPGRKQADLIKEFDRRLAGMRGAEILDLAGRFRQMDMDDATCL